MKLLLIIILFSSNLYAVKSRTISIDYSYQLDQNWLRLASTSEESIKVLLYLLRKSSTGSKIIQKAKVKAARSGKILTDIISVGDTSLCDTTLTRKFYPSSPDQTVYISKSHVYINKDLVLADAVLDLVHELTHFTYRKAFNPYKISFTLEKFIRSTVEGQGGEVDAYMIECKVQNELFHKEFNNRFHCDSIVDRVTGRLSKKKAIEQFYKVGSYYHQFRQELMNFGIGKNQLKSVSDDFPLFLSSVYGVPYPVAAYKEYMNIMEKSCENDLKRLAMMKERVRRLPASNSMAPALRGMKKSYQRRCLNLFVDNL